MGNPLSGLFSRFGAAPSAITKNDIADLLRATPEALEAFEKAYRKHGFDNADDGIFDIDKNDADSMRIPASTDERIPDGLHAQIVNELLSQTETYSYSKRDGATTHKALPTSENAVMPHDVASLPTEARPQLLGNYACRDCPDSDTIILTHYKQMLEAKDSRKAKMQYDQFRQGLDLLDIDPIMYEIIGMNPNSIGHWFPKLVDACSQNGFFKLPDTVIAKVPMTILQMTRLDYMSLTEETRRIIDDWAYSTFRLDDTRDYFVRTGTASSKFDFRNAHVTAGQEVHELGEYLTFIHAQGVELASPLTQPTIYGMHTTNEWCVREFIADTENNPCIYKGLPLHTEYRVFVDCDTNEVLSCMPYWEPETMKNRFANGNDANSPHQIHDYIIYKSHEDKLMRRYGESKDRVVSEIQRILPALNLKGQWSIDVMQNGDNFWIIDMALAQDSAFRESIPTDKRKTATVNWMPEIGM